MKRILTSLAAAIALVGCGGSAYTVTGLVDLMPGDSVFLFDANQAVLAAGVVNADTTFTLKGRLSTPDVVTLSDRSYSIGYIPVLLEPGTIQIKPDGELGYLISGTSLNDSLMLLNQQMTALRNQYVAMPPDTPKEESEAIIDRFNQVPRDMVDANLDNALGLYLFSMYEFPAAAQDITQLADIKARMNSFFSKIQSHRIMQYLHKQVAAIENTQVGSEFTDLSLKNSTGETVALSSLVGPGRWVLLDFWATWCGPCMMEMPHLRSAYGTYKERGFEIYCVSLDNDKDRWMKVVADEEMPWINVLGVGDDKQSEAASSYCIRSIPANYLISPDGIIAAKNLRGDELSAKLAEVMQ